MTTLESRSEPVPAGDPQASDTSAGVGPLRGWMAVLAITLGVFSFTTTEMVPVGLLTWISQDLHVTEGQTGLAVSLYGLTAGVLAPVLTAATGRFDRRTLLTVVLAIFVVGNVCTAFATTFELLMVARIITGFAHGVMWSIAASIATRLVPERHSVRAISIVFSGISIAFVVGIPFGTFVGELTDWRTVFGVVAVLGGIAMVAGLFLVPRLTPVSSLHLSELPALMKIGNLRVALVVTSVVVTGHFAAYTYITPFLAQEAGIAPAWISSLLLLYGAASVIGNFVAGAGAAKALRWTLVVAISVASVSMLFLLFAGTSTWVVVGLLLAWGFAFPALPLCLQTMVLQSAPKAPEAASSVFICSFNVTIALGAAVGGFVVDSTGPRGPLWIGVALTLVAAVVLAKFYRDAPGATEPESDEEPASSHGSGRHRRSNADDDTVQLFILGSRGGEGKHHVDDHPEPEPNQVPATHLVASDGTTTVETPQQPPSATVADSEARRAAIHRARIGSIQSPGASSTRLTDLRGVQHHRPKHPHSPDDPST